jgi:hypothetical protein
VVIGRSPLQRTGQGTRGGSITFPSLFLSIFHHIAIIFCGHAQTSIETELDTIREKTPSIPETKLPTEVQSLAKTSPLEAVDKSWKHLRDRAAEVASVESSVTPIKIADVLIDKGVLNRNEAEAFYRMYQIQENALKMDCFTDVSSATTYSGIAYGLSEKIIGAGSADLSPLSAQGTGSVTAN